MVDELESRRGRPDPAAACTGQQMVTLDSNLVSRYRQREHGGGAAQKTALSRSNRIHYREQHEKQTCRAVFKRNTLWRNQR